MTDYDFKSLNDKEFEIFCADLLGEVEGRRFERFKAGRDSGVDGRYFIAEGKEVVLQCKHWSNTPIAQLISKLGDIEKPKLDKLKPHRYLLIVSNPLSRSDKEKIYRTLSPYIQSESDIYGKEDLNDLLKDKAHIEKRHYKLWLHSSSVLSHIRDSAIIGRSSFSLEEIVRSSSRYVVTENHEAALNLLERLGVVIITGEPGVGKTTLADHLCLHYVTEGFEYLKVGDDLKEAESAFNSKSRQIIYFDDFLGRNYLEALKGHEGNQITQFIRRIASNKNKRFVLTSRSTILNQGKFLMDVLEHSNVQKNEYELKIQSLTELDKAQILYNHIWHSDLESDYIEQLYLNYRYRNIIAHKNFNPRLISYIADMTRLKTYNVENYWEYISDSLKNPSQVWENPFNAQLDDFSRVIVLMVVYNGSGIDENILSKAYYRYLALPESSHLHGRREFQSNIKLLTGSFLIRIIGPMGSAIINLFNPSIGDYVLKRYTNDAVALRLVMQSLRTNRSLNTLRSMASAELLSKEDALNICYILIKYFFDNNFDDTNVAYISELSVLYGSYGGLDYNAPPFMNDVIQFIINQGLDEAIDDALDIVEWGLNNSLVSTVEVLNFIEGNLDNIGSYTEIRAVSSLLSAIPEPTTQYLKVTEAIKNHIVEVVSESLTDFVDVNSVFSMVEYGDNQSATTELRNLIEKEFLDIGVNLCTDDINMILDSFDVSEELCHYYENLHEEEISAPKGPSKLAIDEIDDLFERS